MGHTKGQDNKRYPPLSPRTSIDEAVIKEGGFGGARRSRPGGVGTGAAGGVDDADTEDGRPGAVGQDERPAPLQVIIVVEPRLAIGEVTFPLLVVEDLDEVQGLAAAALLHHDARQGVPPPLCRRSWQGAAGAPRTRPVGAPWRW
jgi:hypothetical protein